MRTLESTVRLLLAAAAACVLVACTGENGIQLSVRTDPLTLKVERPRVAMLDGNTAVISYDHVESGGNSSSLLRSLRTHRHSLPSGLSSDGAAFDAFTTGFTSILSPTAMSDGRDGFAISLVGGDAGGDGHPAVRPLGCVHVESGPATCVSLQLEAGQSLAVAHADVGKAIALFGTGAAIKQRWYDSSVGWGAIADGPAVPANFTASDDGNLVRWRDGTLFLSGATPEVTEVFTVGMGVTTPAAPAAALAVRYDPASARWQPLEPIGFSDRAARIALHPDSPTLAPVAVWKRSSTGRLEYSVWQAGVGWGAAAELAGSTADASPPTAAMTANGDVLVLWTDGPADRRSIVAARRVGGTWQPPVTIGPTTGTPRRITIGVDRFGNAVAAWPNVGSLASATFLVGEGWQTATHVGFLADLNGSRDFDVSMEPGGRALAVWAEPEPAGQPGSHLAVAPVGPSVLSLTAQRYTFGGEPVPVTIRLSTPPAQATTATLTTTLPTTVATVPGSVAIAANQGELTFNVPSTAVGDFVDGRIDVVYGNSSASQLVTLMPEPTDLTLRLTPASVLGGETATLTVQVTPAYPVGLAVDLTSNLVIAPVIARVTTGLSASTATTPIVTLPTFAAQVAVFTGRVRNLLPRTGTLFVNPSAPGNTVLVTGVAVGQGTISSVPAGINCSTMPATCSASFPAGTPVTLTGTPAPGYRFYAWSGDPDCDDGVLTMTQAHTCTAVFQPQLPSYPDGVSWTYLGNLLFGLSTVNPSPAMALDGLNPLVAYVATEGASPVPQLLVNRFEFGTFAALTPSLNVDPLQAASEPSIVTTSTGAPYVAWIEGSGAQQNVYVARWLGGTRWLSVGAPGVPLNFTAGSRASSPSLALDAEQRPMVAWIENGAVKLKRFDGVAWLPAAGGEGPASANADRVRLSTYSVLAGVADPVLAWTQGSGTTRALKVARDFAFTPLGTQVNPASADPLTEFAVLAENGGAIVTWGDGVRPYAVRSRRWNGSDWVDVSVAGDVASHATNRLLSVAMVRNGLVVAHAEASDVAANGASIQVTWKPPGSPWQPLTGPFPFLGDPLVSLPAVEMPSGNSPIVVVVLRNALGQYVWRVLRYYPS